MRTIAYRKWQDGAMIILIGKLPLEGLLTFLPNVNPAHLRIVRRTGFQISYVLLVSQNQFNVLLNNLQQRSNFVINKMAPVLSYRNLWTRALALPLLLAVGLGCFDCARMSTRTRTIAMLLIRSSRRFFRRLWLPVLPQGTSRQKGQAHAARAPGEIVRVEHGTVHILESIDKKVATEVETFINTSVPSIKTGLQNPGNFLGADIGFLFKKKVAFDGGLERLQNSDPLVASYLEEVRKWTEPLIGVRNDLEHDLWIVPRIVYTNNNGRFRS
ncbi:hypothetical protein AAE026_24200 [Bradyrhizobium sp. DN5]|uniref:hypothetical protein n=1 Tax=Bradyrhizobium sp. DN5 TaxID=3056950 RepID=UPI003523A445